MARINYEALLNKLEPDVRYKGTDLDRIWGVNTDYRKSRVNVLVKKKKLKRTGKTSNVEYWLAATTKIEPTGNGVIDAKLRKEAGLPPQPSTLDQLIDAASKVGTENRILKKALLDAKELIEQALEAIK